MNEQRWLNVEMKFTFSIPFDETDEFEEEDFEEIATDYFFNNGGCNTADYEFKFSID